MTIKLAVAVVAVVAALTPASAALAHGGHDDCNVVHDGYYGGFAPPPSCFSGWAVQESNLQPWD